MTEEITSVLRIADFPSTPVISSITDDERLEIAAAEYEVISSLLRLGSLMGQANARKFVEEQYPFVAF